MKLHQFFLIIFTVVLLSIGQVLFKYASEKINITENGILFGLILNPIVIIALIIYGIATITWIISLTGVELRVAYPYAALAFLIVPLLSHLFLGESININTFIGAFFILFGVFISSL